MTDIVYPNTGHMPHAHACAFFSAIPRAVGDLRAQGHLKARDVDVLRELLDYKNRHTTQVDPRQATLAARFGCSVDTVQRSLNRLVAAGLIVKIRLRDRLGRLGRCVYDLAQTLALMPRQAAKLRSGQYGQPAATIEKTPTLSMPQKCGISEVDSEDAVQADTYPPREKAIPSPVAAALIIEGVFPGVAGMLTVKFGEGRCREVLQALKQRRTVRDRAAWIVGALLQGWDVATEATARPQSHHPYTPPRPAGLKPDRLAALDTPALVALEAQARAVLWQETLPAWRDRILTGPSSHAVVNKRMRELLAQGEGRLP